MSIAGIRHANGIEVYLQRAQLAAERPAQPQQMDLVDKVTLSAEARTAKIPPRLASLAEQAQRDPSLAQQLAQGYAFTPLHEMFSLTDKIAGTGPIKYSATGEPVTPESQARFKQQAAQLLEMTSSLYEREKAKGTSDADIFEQLLRMIGSQPADYLDKINWNM